MNKFVLAAVELEFWLAGHTFGEKIRFLRGVSVGLIIAAVGLLAAWSIVPAVSSVEDIASQMAKSRAGGYSECCFDTMSIVAHGGGLDEVIAFMKAKGDTEFSDLISRTNFYAEGYSE